LVLYGSVARGDDTPDSDVDLLVSLVEDRPDSAVKLAVRLERTLSHEMDVARLNRIKDTAPLLLPQAIDEGRVVLDRDGEWTGLKTHRSEIARLTELYRTRNRLQHSSPEIQADEVHRQVRLLLRHLPKLVESYLAWLEKYDVAL
jgi:predicted nucleotidyltransferase